MDQAQHFTGKASAATSGGDNASAEFRAGLEASERECASYLPFAPLLFHHLLTLAGLVFTLAQGSARQVKAWYESSDKAR